jgi:CDP-paratose 2-epimerase
MSARQHVLVTGGSGFVGTNLADRLLRDGARVLVLDNLSRPGVDENVRWLRDEHGDRVAIEVADTRDPVAVEAAVASASAVFHLAATTLASTAAARAAPMDAFRVNALGTLNLLEALRARRDPPPLVHASTTEVYGALSMVELAEAPTRYVPRDARVRARGLGEAQPLELSGPDACSRGTAETYVLAYARSFGLPAVVLRPSCVYGPHSPGEGDRVGRIVARALERRPIVLEGTGKHVRDLLFVDDLVDALVLILESARRLSGEVFNVGGGTANALSPLELVAAIARGSRLEVAFEPTRIHEARYYVADTDKLEAATGWRPRVAPPEGLERLRRWLEAGPPARRRLAA